MELKEQIRDKKEPSKEAKKASHDNKSYASVEERYGFDKYDKAGSDYQRYYSSSKPTEKMASSSGKNSPVIKIKEERIEKEIGGKEGVSKGSPYSDTPGSREDSRDSKSGGGDKTSLPPRSVGSPSMHPSNLPYYPGGYPSYAGSLPYEPQHPQSMMLSGYAGAPFLHPHQHPQHPHPLRYHDGRSPAHSPSSSAPPPDSKGHHPSFYTSARGPEPKTLPSSRPSSDSKPSTPDGKPLPEGVRGGEGEKGEGEPPVQRHLHSHHHTHVVGPPYSLFPPHGPHWNPMM